MEINKDITLRRRIKKDLESKGFIVSKWDNDLEFRLCDYCKKNIAPLKQFSPDGKPNWYCSKKCEQKDLDDNLKKGIAWRCLPAKMDEEYGKLIGGKGFINFICFKKGGIKKIVFDEKEGFIEKSVKPEESELTDVIGAGIIYKKTLSKMEENKCRWYLDNGIFKEIWLIRNNNTNKNSSKYLKVILYGKNK